MFFVSNAAISQKYRYDFAERFIAVLKNYFDMQGTETNFSSNLFR